MPRLRTRADREDNPLWVDRIINRLPPFRAGYGRRVPLPRIYPYQPNQPRYSRSRSPGVTPLIDDDNDVGMSDAAHGIDDNEWEDVDDEGDGEGDGEGEGELWLIDLFYIRYD